MDEDVAPADLPQEDVLGGGVEEVGVVGGLVAAAGEDEPEDEVLDDGDAAIK